MSKERRSSESEYWSIINNKPIFKWECCVCDALPVSDPDWIPRPEGLRCPIHSGTIVPKSWSDMVSESGRWFFNWRRNICGYAINGCRCVLKKGHKDKHMCSCGFKW